MTIRTFKDKCLDSIVGEAFKVPGVFMPVTQNQVHTCGFFDVLHYGHIKMFNDIKAKFPSLKLVVGVASDALHAKRKGHKPLVNGQLQRMYNVASLAAVDYVYLQEEENPVYYIQKFKPTIHVKGSEYKEQDIPEKKVDVICWFYEMVKFDTVTTDVKSFR